jgi:hypothetical protein
MGGKDIDESKYYLGTLCKRNHDYNDTGMSPRFVNGNHACVFCVRKKSGGKSKSLCKSKYDDGLDEKNVKKEVEKFGHKFIGPYINFNKPFKVICKCGINWNAYLSHIRKNGNCLECGKKSPARKTGTKKPCDLCGKLIYIQPHREALYKNIFCSKKCKGEFKRKKYKTICSYCKKTIMIHKCRFTRSKVILCNNQCKKKWQQGKDHPSFKHGKSKTKEYFRRAAIKRNWKNEIKQTDTKGKELIDYAINLKIQVLDLQKQHKEMKNEAKSC